MPDPITLTLGAGFLASGAVTIWATWSRGVALDRLRKANAAWDKWEARAHAEKAISADLNQKLAMANRYAKDAAALSRQYLASLREYRAAEPARIEAAIKEHRRAHMKRISVLGNQSAKRRKREG